MTPKMQELLLKMNNPFFNGQTYLWHNGHWKTFHALCKEGLAEIDKTKTPGVYFDERGQLNNHVVKLTSKGVEAARQ